MTREQAITYLYSSGFSEEQVNTIVKAFEPTTKTCKTCRNYGSHNGVCDICKDYNCFTEANKSEIPNNSTTKNDLGVDCIDRAEVLKLMQDNWHTHNGDWAMQESMDDIRALSAVTPQESFINKPCVSSGVCEHDKNKVLDKIRAEIKELPTYDPKFVETYTAYGMKQDVLKIFDKYKAESEEE